MARFMAFIIIPIHLEDTCGGVVKHSTCLFRCLLVTVIDIDRASRRDICNRTSARFEWKECDVDKRVSETKLDTIDRASRYRVDLACILVRIQLARRDTCERRKATPAETVRRNLVSLVARRVGSALRFSYISFTIWLIRVHLSLSYHFAGRSLALLSVVSDDLRC